MRGMTVGGDPARFAGEGRLCSPDNRVFEPDSVHFFSSICVGVG